MNSTARSNLVSLSNSTIIPASSWASVGIEVDPEITGETRTTCPKCSPHRNKSYVKCLAISVDKGAWYCHHCGWHGTLLDGEKRQSTPNSWKANVVRAIPLLPTTPLPGKVIDWFENRKISEPVLQRNRVAYGLGYMPQIGEWVRCLQMPYIKGGTVRNVKFRDGKKNFCMLPGAELLPYGYDDCIDEDTVVWVEGEIDKLSVEEAGYTNCLSVPNGAPPPNSKSYSSKFDWLKPEEWEGKKHIIAVDSDEPGQTLEVELVRRLGVESCSLVRWPDGVKDANEALVAYGAEELKALLDDAKPVPVAGIVQAQETGDAVRLLYRNGFDRGVHPGWDSLAPHYTVRPGEWTVVTGMPGSGKSEWVDALMHNLALLKGWRFGVFSPENHPIERHVAKLVEKYVGLPFHAGPNPRMREEDLSSALQWVQEHFIFLAPGDDELTVDSVLGKAKALVRRHGINGLVVDPWNELDHSRPAGFTETEYISAAISKFRRFAREHALHVWVVAHPTKLAKDDFGKYPAPTLYDISGSAHWRNKADNGITIHRDIGGVTDEVEIHVGKIRFKTTGKVGLVKLRYDKVTGRYRDLATLQ